MWRGALISKTDNGNRKAATQSVTKYVVTKLMSNYGGFSGSDGPLAFVSEITFWDSMESKESDCDSIESKDSEIHRYGGDCLHTLAECERSRGYLTGWWGGVKWSTLDGGDWPDGASCGSCLSWCFPASNR